MSLHGAGQVGFAFGSDVIHEINGSPRPVNVMSYLQWLKATSEHSQDLDQLALRKLF